MFLCSKRNNFLIGDLYTFHYRRRNKQDVMFTSVFFVSVCLLFWDFFPVSNKDRKFLIFLVFFFSLYFRLVGLKLSPRTQKVNYLFNTVFFQCFLGTVVSECVMEILIKCHFQHQIFVLLRLWGLGIIKKK